MKSFLAKSAVVAAAAVISLPGVATAWGDENNNAGHNSNIKDDKM